MPTSTIDFDHGTTKFTRNTGQTYGERFSLDKTCTLQAIRAYHTNFAGTWVVKVYRVSDGALLTSATIPSQNFVGWTQVDCADVQLDAGTQYCISSYVANSSTLHYENQPAADPHTHASGGATATMHGLYTSFSDNHPTSASGSGDDLTLGMVLEYNEPPATPTGLGPSGATGATSITFFASVTDPEGGQVRARFEYSTDNATWTEVFGGYVASGLQSEAAVTLAPNTTYYLRARAQDLPGRLSGYTATQTVITNRSPSVPGAWTSPTSAEVVNTTDLVEVAAATDPDGQALTYDFDLSLDNGATWTAKRTKAAGTSFTYDYTAEPSTAAAKWRSRAWDGALYGAYSTSPTFTIEHNQAPTPASWASPSSGATLNRGITQRLDWNFNDPNPGDSQSKYDLRYRVGAAAWTTVSAATTNTFHDLAAGSLAAGNYEAQVLTYDARGLVATGWSPSLFFTMADSPGEPVITSPTSGSTIATSTGVIAWSAPSQEAFQVRKVADAAGVADTATVYYDSGEVLSTTARNHPLSFPVNNRYEHLQVRVRVSGLWSAWASIRVLISYTPPAVPVVTLDGDSGLGTVTVTPSHPAPTGLQPAVTSIDLEVRAVAGADQHRPLDTPVRIGRALAASAPFVDRAVASEVEYEYRAVAHGDNGTSTFGAWTSQAAADYELSLYDSATYA